MNIDEEFEEWIQEQASHGACMGGYTFEEAYLARAAWHKAKGSEATLEEVWAKHIDWSETD